MISAEQTFENKSSDEIILYNVRRYGVAGRLYHWTHAMAMMLFLSTGWQIYTSKPIFGDMTLIRTIHIGLGIFIIFWEQCQECFPAFPDRNHSSPTTR